MRCALILLLFALCGCIATEGDLLRFEPFERRDGGPPHPDMHLDTDFGTPQIQLCGCGEVQVQGALEVDDDLAARGRLSAGGVLQVDGTLYSGDETFGTNAPVVLGAWRHAGGGQHGSDLAVIGDAHVLGDLRVNGALDVGGTLFMPEGAVLSSANDVRPRVAFDPLPFEWPCDCAADPAIEDAIEAEMPDDRGRLGLNRDAWANLQSPTDVTLPAGRYVFDAIGGPGALRVTIEGAVEWVIRGDVHVDGGLDVALADGASLRLLIGGTLTVGGATILGDQTRPDALEVHVVRGPAIAISEAFAFSGRLVAPAAELGSSVDLDWRGSAVVRRVSAAAGLRIRR